MRTFEAGVGACIFSRSFFAHCVGSRFRADIRNLQKELKTSLGEKKLANGTDRDEAVEAIQQALGLWIDNQAAKLKASLDAQIGSASSTGSSGASSTRSSFDDDRAYYVPLAQSDDDSGAGVGVNLLYSNSDLDSDSEKDLI